MSRSGSSRAEARLRPPAPRWHEPGEPEPSEVRRLEEALSLPSSVCSVLALRGYAVPDDAKRFLRPRLEHLHEPGGLADAHRAADRVHEALRRGETILVHGDYDVDGICATAILTRRLRRLGGRVVPFVPHRTRDGYDFSEAGLRAAREAGATLVVTVDCGIVAHGTVEAAGALGIDVIVTDHHTAGDTLPPALAVVNPNRADCPYPEKGLCGAAVAWRLADLVTERAGEEDAGDDLLDLVALATVADLVPLTGENRVLVHHGLRRFARSPLPGLQALLEVAELTPADLTAGRLGFQIGPRINAAGRIGEAADALELLLTDDPARARTLARELDRLNTQRRVEDRRVLDEAVEELARTFDPARDFGVVLAAPGWHPGIIGIVASRVVELVHRPVVMISVAEGRARGSARSIPGFHLYEALAACAGHLDRFGGHRQAAGMDLAEEALPAFREAFNAEARRRLEDAELRPILRPDVDLALPDADRELAHWLTYLGPHGIGNPGPLFRTRSVELRDARVVGSNHLKARLHRGGAQLDAIGFGLADRFAPDEVGQGRWDALFRLEKNEWRGRVTAQARLIDLRRESA